MSHGLRDSDGLYLFLVRNSIGQDGHVFSSSTDHDILVNCKIERLKIDQA